MIRPVGRVFSGIVSIGFGRLISTGSSRVVDVDDFRVGHWCLSLLDLQFRHAYGRSMPERYVGGYLLFTGSDSAISWADMSALVDVHAGVARFPSPRRREARRR